MATIASRMAATARGTPQCVHLMRVRFAFIADETIFYPASGGQASDTGLIKTRDGTAATAIVEQVNIADGVAEHLVRLVNGSFAAGDKITMLVNRDVRLFHPRLHSAGELICGAIRNLGHDWYVGGASHHPQQAHVV